MTTAGVLAALARRWAVALVGVGATIAVMGLVLAIPGVYTSKVDVVLIAPRGDSPSTQLVSSEENLIAAAGLVERLVNRGARHKAETSQEVPLEGEGVRNGSVVKLPNSGGQWDYNFVAPVLRVQVVGEDADTVRARLDQLLAEIDDTLRQLQRTDGVPARLMITSRVVPEAAPIVHATGRPLRAAAGVLVIGGFLTCFVCVMLDQAIVRRGRSRFATS